MPLDAVTLSALAAELRGELTGGKIEKIQQPQRDLVLLTVRTRSRGSQKLILSGGVGSARMHFTEAAFENPASPPMFCMLLRKHLLGSRITALEQPGLERVLTLEAEGYDELGNLSRKRLVLELIGRSTNLILVGPEGHILDCLRRVDAGMNPRRQLLPGLLYCFPDPQAKPDFFSAGPEKRRELLAGADRTVPGDKWLLGAFRGLSPLLCRELWYRAGEDWGRLGAAMDAMAETVGAGEFTPYLLLEEGRPRDFSCMPIRQYAGALEGRVYPDFSSLLDAYYTGRDKADALHRQAAELARTIRTARDRQLRKLQNQRQELVKTARREEWRLFGDLITANLYRLKGGCGTSVTVTDYTREDCPEVTIPLDPRKSAQQNAAAYYKDYRKAKTAEQYLKRLIAEGEADLEYLERCADLVERVGSRADIAELRRELTETGFLKSRRATGKKERVPQAQPLRFRSDGGFEIWVGRSNTMNDKLTLELARRGDLWFHTQKIHGSHVIVRTQDREVDEVTLTQAASLAVWFSQARQGGRTPVDYTRVRNVKKPKGARPGGVIYTDYQTLYAVPDEGLVRRLEI